jgi:hypothetical protein
MHPEAFAYVASRVGGAGKCRVLEFGSRNVNGTVRDLLPDADYTGVDIAPGPGVDHVGDAAEWTETGFDLVICCEVLEHTSKGSEIVAAARRALGADGGTLIVTCATDPRAPHSAFDGGALKPNEFYRNVPLEMMRRWLADAGFQPVDEAVHPRGDLYVTATV